MGLDQLRLVDDAAQAREERVRDFAYNAVTRGSDAQCMYGMAGLMAEELGFEKPDVSPFWINQATLLASGPQAGEAIYTPGAHSYTTADHIRGIAQTIARAPTLAGEERVKLLDSMVRGATNGYGVMAADSPAMLVKPLKKYEYEGLVRQELDAATYQSSGRELAALVETYHLFDAKRTHKIVSRVLAAAWAD